MIPTLKAYLKQNSRLLKFEEEYIFHATRKWRIDCYFVYFKDNSGCSCRQLIKIGIEIEGGIYAPKHKCCPKCKRPPPMGHNSVKGILRDMEKYNEAGLMGITIFRFTPEQIEQNKEIELIDKLLNT